MNDLGRNEKEVLVSVAHKIIDQKIGFLDGCNEIAHLLVGSSYENDNDFKIFVLVNSEADHLPLESTRTLWDANALKSKDIELQAIVEHYKYDVIKSCRNLIERFSSR